MTSPSSSPAVRASASADSNAPAIECQALVKHYGSKVAVAGIDLVVQRGQCFGLLGPNGAGKTTTMEMMEGLRRPDAGSCTVCGFDTVEQAASVRERIGVSLQQATMPPEVTPLELLRLYASIYENPLPLGDLLDQFQLMDKARSRVAHLSGGQKQRLALALAIIGRPQVIFLDEPTTGLDPQARRNLWDLIRGLRDEGRAIILSTHYMDEVERLCDRAVVMDHGRVVAEGTPRALVAAYGPESVIDVELAEAAVDAVALSRLPAVTGIKVEEQRVLLYTSDLATSLIGFASYAQQHDLDMGDLRTRSATMDDVFIALTGRSIRE